MAGNNPFQTAGMSIQRAHQTLPAGTAPRSMDVFAALTARPGQQLWTVTVDLANGVWIKMHPTSIKQEDGSGRSFIVEGFLVNSSNAHAPGSEISLYLHDGDNRGHITIQRPTYHGTK